MRCEDSSNACGCEPAVVTAYLELRELGTSHSYAMQACGDDAHRRVGEWVDRVAGDRGEALRTGNAR
jgi:hypothetical protein